MPTAARERLIAAAERLFYAEGVRAVGVDRLLAESGIGRASFYRHFAGKDDLVVTVLGGRLERWREDMAAAVEARGGGVPAVFDVLAEQLAEPGFRGCAAINALVEAADPDSAAHRVAADHKTLLAAYLGGLAGDVELGEQLVILVDGAIVTALRDPTGAPARRAAAIAAQLLR